MIPRQPVDEDVTLATRSPEKLVAVLLRVARVTAGVAESNGSLCAMLSTWLQVRV